MILGPSNSKFRHFITLLGHLLGGFPLVRPCVRKVFEKAQESDSKVETGFRRMNSQLAMSIVTISESIPNHLRFCTLHFSAGS